MEHEAVAARVEIGSADQQHPVEHVQHSAQISFVGYRRQNSGIPPDLTMAS